METLIWIGDDRGLDHILQLQNSSNPLVAEVAVSKVGQYELDEEDMEEEED